MSLKVYWKIKLTDKVENTEAAVDIGDVVMGTILLLMRMKEHLDTLLQWSRI